MLIKKFVSFALNLKITKINIFFYFKVLPIFEKLNFFKSIDFRKVNFLIFKKTWISDVLTPYSTQNQKKNDENVFNDSFSNDSDLDLYSKYRSYDSVCNYEYSDSLNYCFLKKI